MAMLAGPRRKQKVINLRAKNSSWSNDSNKFGQKMLEKMGWSSGKGLGAKENGIVEHVVARYKNDELGLGYEDKNDQWTKHEDDFNALLSNLSNGDNNEEKLISGVSLEKKSKTSKARVHYHKFTRGKDLSRYSEKDLANIFGKKSFKSEEKPKGTDNEDMKTTEQVFTDKGSMEDYFKSKMAKLKSKFKSSTSNIIPAEEENTDYSFKGFSGAPEEENESQGFGFQSFSFYTQNNTEDEKVANSVDKTEVNDEVNIEKKKKKKKKKECERSETEQVDHSVQELVQEELPKKHKKKKEIVVESLLEKKKSNKKRKNSTSDNNELIECAETVDLELSVPKKKKKRKNKDV